jgi:hypothetical protein
MTASLPLADILVAMGEPGRGASASLRWLADWLPNAERRQLDRDDIARIDAYMGGDRALHDLLPAVLPLMRPVWFETAITTQDEMIVGYGAVQARCTPSIGWRVADGVDIGWACYAPACGGIIGLLGPAVVTATGMDRPADIADESWLMLRSAAGVVMRALLLGLGTGSPAIVAGLRSHQAISGSAGD